MRARKDSCDGSPSQKTKLQTSSSASRLIPKKIWKSRSKSSCRSGDKNIIPQWTSQGHCRWLSSTGRWFTLTDTSLLDLTEMERAALKQIAMARLQAFKLGCKIDTPKEHSTGEKKRRPYMLKKKALTTGMFDRKEKRNQEVQQTGLVFGTSLGKCLENERELRLKSTGTRNKVKPEERSTRSSTHCTGSLLDKTLKSTSSCHSLSDILGSIEDDNRNSNLRYGYSESNESLDLDKRASRLFSKTDSDLNLAWQQQGSNVPKIVESCFRHLETYGLNTVGIFRVSSSKRRVRQLRDDFDGGKDVQLTEDHHPHDVAQLLKEYFRDLKEPLLSKELYSAFIATQRLREKQDQRDALQYLICLLPIPNRGTLWSLLKFLSKVASFSEDSADLSGETVTGNKMDSHNLATLFGPNILRSYKSSSDKEYKVESSLRAEERCDVIRVTQTLVNSYRTFFEVNADLLDHVYLHIQQKDPSSLNSLLCVKTNMNDSYEAENETIVGATTTTTSLGSSTGRRISDSVETIPKDDSSEINSPLGSSSSFNEFIFMDADEMKNGYPTRRGHSASNLPMLSRCQDANRLQSTHADPRRRSSEDVNIKMDSLRPSDKNTALSVPDVSSRRLSSPEIHSLSLTGLRSKSATTSPQRTPSPSSGYPPMQRNVPISDKPPARGSPEEQTKPILKSPTENFKVFVTDESSGTERLAGEFQTVKFTTRVVESTRINKTQRPQVCHLLTMHQPRLPKFTLSESTIEEDSGAGNEDGGPETKKTVERASTSSSSSAAVVEPETTNERQRRRRSRPNQREENVEARSRQEITRRRRVRSNAAGQEPDTGSKTSTTHKQPTRRRPNGANDDRDRMTSKDAKNNPDRWKRWQLISSEHMETFV
ncbi:ARHGAP6 (predicted) [Pycnogonum litorale]